MGTHPAILEMRAQFGICLAGKFMDFPPSGLQLQSLVQLVSYLQEAYKTDLEILPRGTGRSQLPPATRLCINDTPFKY